MKAFFFFLFFFVQIMVWFRIMSSGMIQMTRYSHSCVDCGGGSDDEKGGVT